MEKKELLEKELEEACAEARRSHFATMVGKLRAWWIDNDEEEEIVENVVRAAKVALEYYEDKWLRLRDEVRELKDKGE